MKIPTALWRKATIGVISAAVTVAATASVAPAHADPSNVEVPRQAQRVTYDAKTIFRGVFFGRGPVAALVPQYFDGTPAETAATRAAEARLLASVERAHPGTAQGFADALASGSHIATKRALIRTSSIIQDVMKKEYGADASAMEPGQGIVIAVVAAVAVYVWKYVKTYSRVDATGVSNGIALDGLTHDLIVALR